MFFLLAAAKEGESDMKEFFAKKLSDVGPYDQREAVARFIVLWKVRYKVWPAIGERGQKKFNSERVAEEKQVENKFLWHLIGSVALYKAKFKVTIYYSIKNQAGRVERSKIMYV